MRVLLTKKGLSLLREANANNTKLKISKFIFSDEDIALNEEITTLNGWIEKDITLVKSLDDTTVEFTCVVDEEEATKEALTCALQTEQGHIFALAKPPFAFPKGVQQIFKISISYQNANHIITPQNPNEAKAGILNLLHISAVLANEILKNTQDIEKLKLDIRS